MNENEMLQTFCFLKNETNNQNSFEIYSGNEQSFVLISAPHAVTQTREGKIKAAEPMAGVLATFLHHDYGFHAIVKTKNMGDDPNRDVVSTYKQAVKKYIEEHNIRFFIDLHELAPYREMNFNLCINKGMNLNGDMHFVELFEKSMKKFHMESMEPDYPFDASNARVMSAFVHKTCKIPTMQIEMNQKLYVCEEGRYHYKQINQILKMLAHFGRAVTNYVSNIKK